MKEEWIGFARCGVYKMHDAFPKRRLWGASVANPRRSKPTSMQSEWRVHISSGFPLRSKRSLLRSPVFALHTSAKKKPPSELQTGRMSTGTARVRGTIDTIFTTRPLGKTGRFSLCVYTESVTQQFDPSPLAALRPVSRWRLFSRLQNVNRSSVQSKRAAVFD